MARQARTSWVRLGAWTRLAQLDAERAAILKAFPAFRRGAPASFFWAPSQTPHLSQSASGDEGRDAKILGQAQGSAEDQAVTTTGLRRDPRIGARAHP